MDTVSRILNNIIQEIEQESILEKCHNNTYPVEAFLNMDNIASKCIASDERKQYHRALTETSQKDTINKTKKQQEIFKIDGSYICPCPYHEGNKKVRGLERSHVGMK